MKSISLFRDGYQVKPLVLQFRAPAGWWVSACGAWKSPTSPLLSPLLPLRQDRAQERRA